jgi:hypothetical protein
VTEDRTVLEFIGQQGKEPDRVREQFPDFNIQRLQAGLVWLHRIELRETQAPGSPPTRDPTFYMLTPRGAEAIGLDPARIGAA